MSPDGVQQSAVVHLNQRTGWSLVLLEIASRRALRRPVYSSVVFAAALVNGNAQIRNGVGQQARINARVGGAVARRVSGRKPEEVIRTCR